MEYAEILHRCFRCGYCKLPSDYQDINCPAYLKYRFETYSPGGRMWLLRAWLDKKIEASPRLAEIMFSCAACGNCTEHCAFPDFKNNLLNAFIAGRAELVNTGQVPPGARDFFQSIHRYGNPYKLPEADRGKWVGDLDVQPYTDQDYLFFPGCVGAYDERGQKMSRAVAGLFNTLGLSFGILGPEEKNDGNELNTMGERGLFEHMARENIATFQAKGVNRIVTLSPHAFHAMKNEYPKLGGGFQVQHYSNILAERIQDLSFDRTKPAWRVTYHDPCYLGRHNWEYQAARSVLSAIPGIELIEMDRSKANALCCGGGGGNFFTDVLGVGPDSPSRVRVREAAETGANVLAVACPQCAKMLEDAVKAEELETRLKVMDLAEIVTARIDGA